MKTKIRLASATVRFICTSDEGLLRFGGIGSDGNVFEINKKYVLNFEAIDLADNFIRIVTSEATSYGLFNSITFTREIELPK